MGPKSDSASLLELIILSLVGAILFIIFDLTGHTMHHFNF